MHERFDAGMSALRVCAFMGEMLWAVWGSIYTKVCMRVVPTK